MHSSIVERMRVDVKVSLISHMKLFEIDFAKQNQQGKIEHDDDEHFFRLFECYRLRR